MEKIRLFKEEFSLIHPLPLSKEEERHLCQVLQLSPGQHITVFTPNHEYTLRIKAIDNHALTFTIVDQQDIGDPKGPEVTLIQCLPKQDKLADVIRMCTEMGVTRIVPVTSERSVVQLDKKGLDHKMKRWETVLDSANTQCQRMRPAILDPVRPFKEAVDLLMEQDQFDLNIALWEDADEEESLKKTLTDFKAYHQSDVNKFTIVIGPEGGLTQAEIDFLRVHGYNVASLGETILRTEHAGFATLAQIAYEFQ